MLQSAETARTPAVAIIGAGHAGGSAAAQLRQQGWKGRIIMIGEEGELPYQRPPLSKEWLWGGTTLEKLLLRKAAFYDNGQIEVRLAETVEAIDRDAKTILTRSGEHICYDNLVLATGARPRELPHAPPTAQGVFYLRSLPDAQALAEMFRAARSIAFVGGGYIRTRSRRFCAQAWHQGYCYRSRATHSWTRRQPRAGRLLHGEARGSRRDVCLWCAID